jgi:chemotaxis protein histidine kinase CheA
MQADQDAFQQELDELVKSYLQRLPGKLESIQRVASSLHAAADTRKVLHELRTLVHRLSGSAGTYGCPDVGKAARDYENLIDIYLKFGIDSDSEDYEQLEKRLGKLEMTITHTVKVKHP